nr:PREDICTED: uncharacterized protein LOC105663525 [Megachile rotundata]
MTSVKDPTSRLLRWRLKLDEYDYKVIYKAGKYNVNADALSRNPAPVLPIHSDPPTPDMGEQTPSRPPAPTVDNETDETNTDTSDPSDDDDDNHIRQATLTIVNIRDRLIMRRDNLAVFVTVDQHLLDQGSIDLINENKLQIPNDLECTIPRVVRRAACNIILLPVTLKATQNNVSNELKLSSISISRTNFAAVPWTYTAQAIANLFEGTGTTIFACSHEIRIPAQDRRQELLTESHVSSSREHRGFEETYREIKGKYYWPTLRNDIRMLLNTCASCQLRKLTRRGNRQALTLTDTAGKAFDKVSFDTIGPLPCTDIGNRHILIIQDLLTKYSLAIPLRKTSAAETADAFVNYFICRFGAPKAILTDQSTNFTNALVKAVARRFKIAHFQTTIFLPQGNGPVEQSHLLLTEYLKPYLQKENWDEWLNLAMFVGYGKPARAPAACETLTMTTDRAYDEFLKDLDAKISHAIVGARENLTKAQARARQYRNNQARTPGFKIGDRVVVISTPGRERKHVGPYEVVEVLTSDIIKISVNGKMRAVRTDGLRLFEGATTMGVHIINKTPSVKTPPLKTITKSGNINASGTEPRHSSTGQYVRNIAVFLILLLVTISTMGKHSILQPTFPKRANWNHSEQECLLARALIPKGFYLQCTQCIRNTREERRYNRERLDWLWDEYTPPGWTKPNAFSLWELFNVADEFDGRNEPSWTHGAETTALIKEMALMEIQNRTKGMHPRDQPPSPFQITTPWLSLLSIRRMSNLEPVSEVNNETHREPFCSYCQVSGHEEVCFRRDHFFPPPGKTRGKQPSKKPGRRMQGIDIRRICWPWKTSSKQQPPQLPEQPGSATGGDGTLKGLFSEGPLLPTTREDHRQTTQ